MASTPEASSSVIWPPIIYASAAASAVLLGWINNLSFQSEATRGLALILGIVIAALGLLMLLLAGRSFTAVGTPIAPTQPTKALVFDGIYNHTRNPMYLGFTLVLIGLGLIFDELWFIIAAPLAMFAVTKLAIEREEAYLERKFGAEYLAYRGRVRRWV